MAGVTNLSAALTSPGWNGSAFESTVAFTVPEGSDFISVVTANENTISSVTIGASEMARTFNQSAGDKRAVSEYSIAAPAAGVYDLTVLMAVEVVVFISINSISGASGVGSFAVDGSYTTNKSVSVTTEPSDAVIDILTIDDNAITATATAGQSVDALNVGQSSTGSKIATTTSTTMSYSHAEGRSVLGAIVYTAAASGPDYTARKGSTATITHTLTADGITTATLDGETVTIGTQSGQDADINLTDTITTSGEYDLVLGDGVDTETFTVQYNVIGLPSNTLLKDGAALASLADVKLTVLDASGTRIDRQTGLTTDADGLTGVTPVAAGAVDDPVEVSFFSPGSEVGIVYETTLGLL